jgi:hypothetical protein
MKRAGLVALLHVACSPSTPAPVVPEGATTDLVVPPLPAPAPPAAATATASASPAAPPPTARNDPRAAEERFRAGREAFARGDYATARAMFTESLAADGAVGTLLNLAETELRLGDTASARRHLREAYDRATAAGDRTRATFAKTKLDALGP